MEYRIKIECKECDGYGSREHQIAVDKFRELDCDECEGTGHITLYEVYDSIDDVKADYPKATIRAGVK
jgi:DnaJ-class molecular chaperone